MVSEIWKNIKNLVYYAPIALMSILPSCDDPYKDPVEDSKASYITQSVNLKDDIEIKYSATLYKVEKAELKIKKDGKMFDIQEINDVSHLGNDFNKTYNYNNNKITKGEYEFILKAENLEKINSIKIPNYKPTADLSELEINLIEGTEKTIKIERNRFADKNPEDNPVYLNSVNADERVSIAVKGENLTIKSFTGNIGQYQVEIEFGSPEGGLEKAVLTGNVLPTPVNHTINMFKQTNDSTLYCYGSGDVNNDNKVNLDDLTALNELIITPRPSLNPGRLYDISDVNGDGEVNFFDAELLEKKVNGKLEYLPGEWNKLKTREERESWLKKMFLIDKTNELPYIEGVFTCVDFVKKAVMNFQGFKNPGEKEENDSKDNGRFNIPLCHVSILPNIGVGHAVNSIVVGDDIEKFEDHIFISPQTDMVVYPGSSPGFPSDCKLEISTIAKREDGKFIKDVPVLIYEIKNKIPNLVWINDDPNLNLAKRR